jgi:hypothetical protein
MKRMACFLSIVMSIGLITPSYAKKQGWVLIQDNEDVAIYYDPSSVKVKGNVAAVWSLVENRDGVRSWSSARNLYLFDCSDHKGEITETIFYSGHMGMGRIMGFLEVTSNDGEVPEIASESASDALYKVACSKSKHLLYKVPDL